MAEINAKFIFYVLTIVVVSWLPLFIVKLLLKKLDPSDFEKLMKNVKRRKINTKIFSS